MAASRFSCQLVLSSSGTEAPNVQARRSGKGRDAVPVKQSWVLHEHTREDSTC